MASDARSECHPLVFIARRVVNESDDLTVLLVTGVDRLSDRRRDRKSEAGVTVGWAGRRHVPVRIEDGNGATQ